MFDQYDKFDIALALYHWLQHNWNGLSDPLYRDFCILTSDDLFRPARSMEYFENIESDYPEVMVIYDQLTIENYSQALDRVVNYKSVE
jgi:hypothetical protein